MYRARWIAHAPLLLKAPGSAQAANSEMLVPACHARMLTLVSAQRIRPYMNPYQLPPDLDVGQRAKRLRRQLGLSTAEVAERAGVSEQDVIVFERTGDGSVQTMFSIHCAISGEADLASLFTMPKFECLADVIEFERRRRGLRT